MCDLAVFPPTHPTAERLAFLVFVFLPISAGALLALPVCLCIAIFRYRLWDIDILIRKTLQYGLLTALLALVYFGTIVLLQSIIHAFTGGQSPVTVVVSTLLIAALFTLLRRWIQDWIDRRFYRKKYDAQQVLAAFATTARDEVQLDQLTDELKRVVAETIQPNAVGIWLKPGRKP